MGFWIFMFTLTVLIPAIMIAGGILFLKSAPKRINYFFGYRTERSMKNRETWEFAHKYCGRLWLYMGAILLPFSAVPMLFLIGQSTELIGIFSTVICTVDTLAVIASIVPTEIALKKNFDEDGNRI